MPASRKLAKTVAEFHTYITANEDFIPNYGDRYRYGEVISTAFVDSTVKGGDQQALRQEAADALDEEGRPSSVAGASPGVERRPAADFRALVSRHAQYRHFSSTSGVVAPGLEWSRCAGTCYKIPTQPIKLCKKILDPVQYRLSMLTGFVLHLEDGR